MARIPIICLSITTGLVSFAMAVAYLTENPIEITCDVDLIEGIVTISLLSLLFLLVLILLYNKCKKQRSLQAS